MPGHSPNLIFERVHASVLSGDRPHALVERAPRIKDRPRARSSLWDKPTNSLKSLGMKKYVYIYIYMHHRHSASIKSVRTTAEAIRPTLKSNPIVYLPNEKR
jgi:hypothetical protein